MEAAGFCELVPSFSCNELTYVIKIVSDTANSSSTLITKNLVRDLIEKQLPKILAVLGQIEILVQEEKKRLSLQTKSKISKKISGSPKQASINLEKSIESGR